jgi:hypothetical protein
MIRASWWLGVLALCLCGWTGCAGDKDATEDPVLIRAGDRVFHLSDVEHEADRVRGEGWWDRVDRDRRLEFTNLIAKKEILVLNAIEKAGGELTPRSQIIWNRWLEKQAQNRYLEHLRRSIEIPPTVYDSVAAVMQEERFLVQVVCDDESTAREIHAGVRAGGDFDAIASDYEERMSERVHFVTVGWVTQPRLAPPIAEALFALEEPGAVSEPFETMRYGWHIVRYDSLRTTGLGPESPEVRAVAEPLYVSKRMRASAQEIKDKYDLRYHDECIEPIRRAFAAMYDSMNVGRSSGVAIDWQALPPPLHRFTAQERAMPFVEYSGGTLTLGDFVRDLLYVDLDYWPTIGDSAATSFKVRGRMDRWIRMREVEALDLFAEPDFARAMQRKRDELFLEQFERANLAMFRPTASEDEIRAFWDANQNRYVSRDLVGYSLLRFPAGAENLAWRTHEQILAGADFARAAGNARASNKFVIFEADLDPTSGPPYEDITALAMEYAPHEDGTPFVTQPLPLPDGDFVILRVYFRQKPNTLDFASARDFVERDLLREQIERDLLAMLDELKETYRLQVFEAYVP